MGSLDYGVMEIETEGIEKMGFVGCRPSCIFSSKMSFIHDSCCVSCSNFRRRNFRNTWGANFFMGKLLGKGNCAYTDLIMLLFRFVIGYTCMSVFIRNSGATVRITNKYLMHWTKVLRTLLPNNSNLNSLHWSVYAPHCLLTSRLYAAKQMLCFASNAQSQDSIDPLSPEAHKRWNDSFSRSSTHYLSNDRR